MFVLSAICLEIIINACRPIGLLDEGLSESLMVAGATTLRTWLANTRAYCKTVLSVSLGRDDSIRRRRQMLSITQLVGSGRIQLDCLFWHNLLDMDTCCCCCCRPLSVHLLFANEASWRTRNWPALVANCWRESDYTGRSAHARPPDIL